MRGILLSALNDEATVLETTGAFSEFVYVSIHADLLRIARPFCGVGRWGDIGGRVDTVSAVDLVF